MDFHETPLEGAYVIEPKKIVDDRGFFGRVWCKDEFEQIGLNYHLAQSNFGFSHHKGTLRGLHFQVAPHAEVKILRCTKGSIFDVIVDLRRDSKTFKKWFGIELNEKNSKMIYVPEGFAQGYMTLEDNTEIYYHTTCSYHPESAFGVRYNDPAFQIDWPLKPAVISEQDQKWPDFA